MSVLGKAHQWACLLFALFHIGVFGRVQDGDILFPFHNDWLDDAAYWLLRYLHLLSISDPFWHRWASSGIRSSAATSI